MANSTQIDGTKKCWWCGVNDQTAGVEPYCSQEHRGEMARSDKIKLWAKFVNHQYAAWSALFEMITGFKPPKLKEISAIISGH